MCNQVAKHQAVFGIKVTTVANISEEDFRAMVNDAIVAMEVRLNADGYLRWHVHDASDRCFTPGERKAIMAADLRSDGCSCHINPPCSFCESMDEEEAEAYRDGGMDAIEELHRRREDEQPDDDETERAMRGMSMDEALESFRTAAAMEGQTVVVPDDPPTASAAKKPFRWSFWLATFPDERTRLVCKLRATREEALEAARRQHPGLGEPRDIQTLPYPNHDVKPSEDYPYSHPGFCYASYECAGKTCCPKRISCTN